MTEADAPPPEAPPPAAPLVRPRVWPVFVAFVVVAVGVQVLGASLFAAWAFLMTPAGQGANGMLASLERLIQSPAGLATGAVVSAAGLAAGALFAASLSPVPWRQRLRLTLRGVTLGSVALAVAGTLAVSQALDAAVWLAGLSGFGALDFIARVLARASSGWIVAFCVCLALLPGIAEELFFRGYMQTRLAQALGRGWAVAIAAVCFGAIHFDPVHVPVAVALGLFLGFAVERTGSIVPAIAAHVVNNLIAVLTARVGWPATVPVRAAVLLLSLGLAAACALALLRLTPGARPVKSTS